MKTKLLMCVFLVALGSIMLLQRYGISNLTKETADSSKHATAPSAVQSNQPVVVEESNVSAIPTVRFSWLTTSPPMRARFVHVLGAGGSWPNTYYIEVVTDGRDRELMKFGPESGRVDAGYTFRDGNRTETFNSATDGIVFIDVVDGSAPSWFDVDRDFTDRGIRGLVFGKRYGHDIRILRDLIDQGSARDLGKMVVCGLEAEGIRIPKTMMHKNYQKTEDYYDVWLNTQAGLRVRTVDVRDGAPVSEEKCISAEIDAEISDNAFKIDSHQSRNKCTTVIKPISVATNDITTKEETGHGIKPLKPSGSLQVNKSWFITRICDEILKPEDELSIRNPTGWMLAQELTDGGGHLYHLVSSDSVNGPPISKRSGLFPEWSNDGSILSPVKDKVIQSGITAWLGTSSGGNTRLTWVDEGKGNRYVVWGDRKIDVAKAKEVIAVWHNGEGN